MRVLVIFSWDDDISKRRQARVRHDPRLESYDFHQGFALPSPSKLPESNELFQEISTAIETTKPEVLLIHTGAAYDRSPQAFADALRRIRETYPILRLGYQHPASHRRMRERRRIFLERPGIFEPSNEVTVVENDLLERLGIFEQSDGMKAIERDFFD